MKMKNALALITTACLTLFSLPAISAQSGLPNEGEAVVIGGTTYPPSLYLIAGGPNVGACRTLLISGSLWGGMSRITPAPRNNGLIFGATVLSGGRVLCQVDQSGRLSTLPRIPVYPPVISDVSDVSVDQSGDIVVLSHSYDPRIGGVFRWLVSGQIKPLCAGIAYAVAMEVDLKTGDFLVTDGWGNLHRIDRSGQITSIAKGAFPYTGIVNIPSSMHTDPATGAILAIWGSGFMRYDPRTTFPATPIHVAPSGVVYLGLDHDPVNGGFYRVSSRYLERYDPRLGSATTLVNRVGGTGVATWGSRPLTGSGVAVPGAAYSIHVSLKSEAGQVYQAGAAFGTLRGIPSPKGRIPLDPDPLFFLSLSNSPIFSHFRGRLDAAGAARLSVYIPLDSACRGVRFYLAVITLDATGIRRITEPIGVSID